MSHTFTEDDVRSKAYELWEQAGRPDGGAEIYWTQAQMVLGDRETALPAPAIDELSPPADTRDTR